jgi:hypothetical protein
MMEVELTTVVYRPVATVWGRRRGISAGSSSTRNSNPQIPCEAA